jgi:hypothetical protein
MIAIEFIFVEEGQNYLMAFSKVLRIMLQCPDRQT